MSEDECSPHGIPRPDLKVVYFNDDDIPLVIWNVEIFRQSPGYIRVSCFMSMDKRKVEHILETGPSIAGPWRELKRHL